MSLSEIISTAINNPECSILTGMIVGQMGVVKFSVTVVGLYFLIKLVDKLAFEPFIDYLKHKWSNLINKRGKQ